MNKKYLCAGGIVFSRETGEVILDPYAYGDGLRYARAGIIETENGFLIPAREESENYYLLWADVHNKNVTIESVETDRLYYRAVDPEVMLGVYGAFDEEADYFTVRNIQSGQVVWRRPRHELEPYGGVLLGRTVIHKKKLYVIEGIDRCTVFDLMTGDTLWVNQSEPVDDSITSPRVHRAKDILVLGDMIILSGIKPKKNAPIETRAYRAGSGELLWKAEGFHFLRGCVKDRVLFGSRLVTEGKKRYVPAAWRVDTGEMVWDAPELDLGELDEVIASTDHVIYRADTRCYYAFRTDKPV